MNNAMIVLALFAGLFLGIFYFGGLWLTVKHALKSKEPIRWFLGSLILRTGMVLLGFYYVSLGSWHYMLACLLGFVIGRYTLIRWTKLKGSKRLRLYKNRRYGT